MFRMFQQQQSYYAARRAGQRAKALRDIKFKQFMDVDIDNPNNYSKFFSKIPKINPNLKFNVLFERNAFCQTFKKIFNPDFTTQNKYINLNTPIYEHKEIRSYRDLYVCYFNHNI